MQVVEYTTHQTITSAAESQNLQIIKTFWCEEQKCWVKRSAFEACTPVTICSTSRHWQPWATFEGLLTLIILWGIQHALSHLKENIIVSFGKIPQPRASLGLWIFLERIRNKCWDFETAPPDISLMSFCYFRPITTTLSGSLLQFAAFWALKLLENETYFYECLYIIQGTCKRPPCY